MDIRLSVLIIKAILICLHTQVLGLGPKEPTPVEVLRHQTRTLPCRVDISITQSNKVNVNWFKRKSGSPREIRVTSGTVSLHKKIKVNKVGPNEWNIVITRIDESDEAVYRCEWTSIWRTETVALYQIVVESPPALDESLTSPKYVTFREGDVANLTCVMTGRPEPTITWFRHHRNDFSNPESLGVTGNILTIPDIRKYAGDVYLCVGENRHERQGWEIDVKVRFKPHLEVHEPIIAAPESSRVQMSCLVQASSSVTWHWFNNKGDRIKPNFKYSIEPPARIEGYPAEVATLVMKRSFWDKRDYGTYRCQAATSDHKVDGTIIIKDPREVG